jgi:hypothetical protein
MLCITIFLHEEIYSVIMVGLSGKFFDISLDVKISEKAFNSFVLKIKKSFNLRKNSCKFYLTFKTFKIVVTYLMFLKVFCFTILLFNIIILYYSVIWHYVFTTCYFAF